MLLLQVSAMFVHHDITDYLMQLLWGGISLEQCQRVPVSVVLSVDLSAVGSVLLFDFFGIGFGWNLYFFRQTVIQCV